MSRKFHSQRRKKRKFCGNQFSSKEGDSSSTKSNENKDGSINVSAQTASEDKIQSGKSRLSDVSYEEPEEETCDVGEACTGRRIVNIESLVSAIEQAAVCKACKEGSLMLREDGRMGLQSQMTFQCVECGEETSFSTDCKTGRLCPVNRSAVLATKLIGRGYASFSKFCNMLDLPGPMAKRTFDKHSKEIRDAAVLEAKESMATAVQQIRELNNCEGDEIADIAITIDGTWMKRGHSSLYGIVLALSWQTGKVVDYSIMSKFCHECNYWDTQEDRSLQDYLQWKANHVCDNTHEGSSNSMEVEGTTQIFSRSISKNKLRYVTMISDGDCKNHASVVASKPYGDVPIEKEECVGHVQKRMGRRLRDLKHSFRGKKLSDGKSIGGKDRLTDNLIDLFQKYYGKAIRTNKGNKEGMKTAIWAILYHTASSAENPRHEYCPEGENSWCGWQRDKASGLQTYKHKTALPESIVEVVKPVFEALTRDELLERCLEGATQNQNESLNSVIWSLLPKETFAGLASVETACAVAAARFNDGAHSTTSIMRKCGLNPGRYCLQAVESEDSKRIYHSRKKSREGALLARQERRNKRKTQEELHIENEGETYGYGLCS